MKLIGATVKRSRSSISYSVSPKSISPIEKVNEIHRQFNNQNHLATQSACAINLFENELPKNSIPSHSLSLDYTDQDNILSNHIQSKTSTLEKQNSTSSSRTLTNHPEQFSFESVSSEFSEKMATLFQPKNERQTFV